MRVLVIFIWGCDELTIFFIDIIKKSMSYPREHSSVGRDIAYYMQRSGSNPGLRFSTIKLCELQALDYLTKKKSPMSCK